MNSKIFLLMPFFFYTPAFMFLMSNLVTVRATAPFPLPVISKMAFDLP